MASRASRRFALFATEPAVAAAAVSRDWRSGFLDEEYDIPLAAFDSLQSVARHSDQMGNVYRRERIGAAHFQPISGRQGFEGLAGLERRKGAVQSRQIELVDGHVPACADGSRSVNRHAGDRIAVSAQARVRQKADRLAGLHLALGYEKGGDRDD